MTNDAWGYVRISQESDASLEKQKEDIRTYARENDLNLQTTRNDGKNTSGFNEDRHEYQIIKGKIESADIDAIITRDRARMARDFDERMRLILLLRDTGIEWHVVEAGGKLDVENVENAGIEALHAMTDHVKKMVEIERSKKAVQKRIERGCYQGAPPAGMQFADDGCHLEKSDEWDDLEQAATMLEQGESLNQIERETEITRWSIKQLRDRGFDWFTDTLEEYSK